MFVLIHIVQRCKSSRMCRDSCAVYFDFGRCPALRHFIWLIFGVLDYSLCVLSLISLVMILFKLESLLCRVHEVLLGCQLDRKNISGLDVCVYLLPCIAFGCIHVGEYVLLSVLISPRGSRTAITISGNSLCSSNFRH